MLVDAAADVIDDAGAAQTNGEMTVQAEAKGSQPFTPNNSTSKIRVAFGGMTPPAPRAP
jgi:hypothetical protein